MNRRGFLKGILAAGVAPWVVTKAGVLMPTRPVASVIVMPKGFGLAPLKREGSIVAYDLTEEALEEAIIEIQKIQPYISMRPTKFMVNSFWLHRAKRALNEL